MGENCTAIVSRRRQHFRNLFELAHCLVCAVIVRSTCWLTYMQAVRLARALLTIRGHRYAADLSIQNSRRALSRPSRRNQRAPTLSLRHAGKAKPACAALLLLMTPDDKNQRSRCPLTCMEYANLGVVICRPRRGYA